MPVDVVLRTDSADSAESVRLLAGPRRGQAHVRRPVRAGDGLARRLVARLEVEAVALGASVDRLDTSRDMAPAVALYRSSGYREVEDYNGNPDAGWWFEKSLRP